MANIAQKMVLLLNKSGAVTLDSYITDTIAPMLYYKFNETSGALIDYGSETANGTVTGATQNQTGQLGAGEAYLFDGVDDNIVVSNADIPTVKALTTQRRAFLFNATNEGEASQGVFCIQASSPPLIRFASNARIVATVDTSGTDASVIAVGTSLADLLGNWGWLFMDYDDANSLGNGRKIRLFKGANGTLTQLSLGTDTAATGTVVSSVNDLWIGNRSALDWTFNGLMDTAIVDSGLWTTAEMQQLIDLSEV